MARPAAEPWMRTIRAVWLADLDPACVQSGTVGRIVFTPASATGRPRQFSRALAGKTKLSRGDRCALPAIALGPRTQDHEHAKLDREAIDPWRVNWRLPAQRGVTRRA